jgi:hypothetical protein
MNITRVFLLGLALIIAGCTGATQGAPSTSPAVPVARAPHGVLESYIKVHNRTGTDAWITIYGTGLFGVWVIEAANVVRANEVKTIKAIIQDNEIKVRVEIQPPKHPFVDRTVVNKSWHQSQGSVCIASDYGFTWC